MKKPIYLVGEDVFTLKPTSITNTEQITGFLDDWERGEAGDDATLGDMIRLMRDGDLYLAVFKILTTGPHERIDPREFDAKLGEVAMTDFFPSATVMSLRRIGFLPF